MVEKIANLQKEISTLQTLVKAWDAIKRKYGSLQFKKARGRKVSGNTLKSITEPHEILISPTHNAGSKINPKNFFLKTI